MKIEILLLLIVVIWGASKIAGVAIEYHFQKERLKIEREALHERSKADCEMIAAIRDTAIESIKKSAYLIK